MASKPLKIAQGFPGQIGLLAQQMANGFGGGLLGQTNYLNSIYDPVVMPKTFNFGGTKKKPETKADPKKPSTRTPGTNSGQTPTYRRIGSDR